MSKIKMFLMCLIYVLRFVLLLLLVLIDIKKILICLGLVMMVLVILVIKNIAWVVIEINFRLLWLHL